MGNIIKGIFTKKKKIFFQTLKNNNYETSDTF